MDNAIRIQQHVVRLDISVHDALLVYVPHCATKLRHPKAHGLLGERLPRDVEAQVAAIHQIDYYVSAPVSSCLPGSCDVAYRYSMSWKLYRRLQRKGWFRCSSMRRSRMMLRTLSDRTTVTQRQHQALLVRGPAIQSHAVCRPTFIFPYVLERKREAGVFPLDDAHLAEGALANNSQQSEVVEVHFRYVSLG
jgi:hypothetical protein